MNDRCDYCEGPWDRPGRDDCDDERHATPTLAQQIVAKIEWELHSRRNVGWQGVDEDIADQIRDKLAEIVGGYLAKAVELSPADVREVLGRLNELVGPPTPVAVVIVKGANLDPDTWHVFEDADDALAWRESLPAGTWVQVVKRMGWEFHRKGEAIHDNA